MEKSRTQDLPFFGWMVYRQSRVPFAENLLVCAESETPPSLAFLIRLTYNLLITARIDSDYLEDGRSVLLAANLVTWINLSFS